MKEKHFLNLSSEIPKLSKNEADQLKGGFKKVATKPSVQMSGDINKNCHGNSGDEVVMKTEMLMSIANFHVNAIHSDENLVPLRLNLQY